MFDISGEMCTLASWVPYTIIMYFLSFSMSHNLNQAAFNSCKHSFVCTLLIQVYYSAAFNPAASAAATAAADVITSHRIWLQSRMSDEWRSLRSMKVSCERPRSASRTLVPTSPFPSLVFRCILQRSQWRTAWSYLRHVWTLLYV